MDKVKLAIVGMGNMGCKYADMIVSGQVRDVELVAVTRVSDERRAQYAHVFKRELKLFQSADELFDAVGNGELNVDAVLIVTPHMAHAKQALRAMQLGLHVLCDKPSGAFSRQARIMNEEAAKHNELVFGMMFNQRVNPVYQKMKEITATGIYGRLKRVNWVVTDWYRPNSYYDSVSWRGTWEKDGGGILLNQCPHNLDLLQWICGMPISVQAFCKEGKYHNIEVEDEVTAYFEFANGTTGTFYSTTGEASGINRLELSFDNALLVCEKGQLRVWETGFDEPEYRRTETEHFPKFEREWKQIACDGEDLKHVGILQNFVDAVLEKEPLFVDGAEGSKSLLLSNALYLSSWQRRMVELPGNDEEERVFEKSFEEEAGKKGLRL